MKKRILITFVAIAAVAVGVVGMSAFEAHVINVTAKIENALSVLPDKIEFGTVFPEEVLVEQIDISMSQSFIDVDNADDIDYVIKQKPKPKDVEPDGKLKPDYNQYKEDGQFWPQLYPYTIDNEADRAVYCHTHIPTDPGDPNDPYYINCYPSLCEYLSKHDADPEDNNDGADVDALHDPGVTLLGRLAKSEQDATDLWDIDLLVPCFEGACAQDNVIPEEYQLDPRLESEVFGCDLWIEVTGVSRQECGNEIVEGSEDCDEGPDGGPIPGTPNWCESDCTIVPA